jgi:hypothetical protein
MTETTTTDTTTTDTTTTTAKPWFDGRDPEFVGTLATRGYDKKEAPDVALEFWKAHKEAQQFISKLTGTPDKDSILIRPKADAPEADHAAFYNRLGRPEKEDGYAFKTDGEEDKKFADYLGKKAWGRGLTKEQAEGIFADLASYGMSMTTERTTQATEKLAVEDQSLRTNWGANYGINLIVAQRGARDMGVSEAAFDELRKQPGFASRYEEYRKHGQAIGEDKFLTGNSNPSGVFTFEQAMARKGELMRDPEWTRKYLSGGAAEKREITDLNKIIAQGQAERRAA